MNNKMQGYLSFLFVVAMMLVVVFGVARINKSENETMEDEEEEGALGGADGVYEGQSTGYGGPIVAKVTIRNSVIENIEVTGDSETQGLGSVAIEELPDKMLKEKTVEVDGMSGATISSNAIKEAVKSALAIAGLDTDIAAFQ